MHSPFAGELFGTLVLILLGDGVVACVLLDKSKGQNSGWIVITAGWAFAVLIAVMTALAAGSPDAHINPAVTIAFAVLTGDYSKIPVYVPAQFIGAFLGAALVWLQYLPHWGGTQDKDLKLAVFCTGPAIRNVPANLLSEIIGTIVLIVGVAAIFSKAVAGSGIPSTLGPYMVALLVWGIGLSLGGTTGYAINPARDLGPRIAHAVLPVSGKGSSDWGYAWIPVIGPAIGGVLAAVLVAVAL
ncbi:MIP/aquaporin family protein [Xanthobacter versatilis]|uniref:MIP/aquaporin family protein n=1 Tax=Xanthobacter autotrophicus (strain ATCC BAA-1158 / Py2) TaxID=78245 RepID=UPI00372CB5D1